MTEQQEPTNDPKRLAREVVAAALASARGEVEEEGVQLADTSGIPEEEPGTRIGRFKLLQIIGEGGFGTVWMAEQYEPVKRKVALKILKLGMDTKRVVARFEAERQALAMMDHPNIAKVLDGGATETGRPYFVMELVKGVPITEYCRAASLDTRGRVELFVQVCRAVQHAHQKGIIHRDLKPTNVMVTLHDGKPVPKVIDFGIAKATNQELTTKTLFTDFRQFIGTPQYMSPEQAEMSGLDIDTRSDIYSLGVLLYELLTGSTPIDARRLAEAGFGELQRLIREEEPPKPSTRLSTLIQELSIAAPDDPSSTLKSVRGDLDWIVMCALDKDRTRRYETADAFAQDLERHLIDEPVIAGPPTALYRTVKFARRHRAGLFVAALIGVIVVLGVMATSVGFVNARRAQEHAMIARREAEHSRELAAREAESAQAVNSFLTEMLASADPLQRLYSPHSLDGQDFQGAGVARTSSIAEMMIQAAERLGHAFENEPVHEASLRETIGMTLAGLSRYREALPNLERALELRQEHLGTDHTDTLRSMLTLAAYRRGAEGERLAREAFEGLREAYGAEHVETLTAQRGLARLLYLNDRVDEAKALFRSTLEEQQRVLGAEHPDTLVSMHLHSQACLWEGWSEGLALAETVHAVTSKKLADDHPFAIAARAQLAAWRFEHERFEEAEALYWSTIEPCRRVLGDDHWMTGSTLLGAAEAARSEEHRAQRVELLAVVLVSNVARSYQQLAASRLGVLLALQGSHEAALAHLRRAVTLAEASDDLRPFEKQRARVELGLALILAGDEAGASEAFVGSVEALTQTTNPSEILDLQRWRLLSDNSQAAGEEVLAWASAQPSVGEDPDRYATLVGLAQYRAGQLEEARATFIEHDSTPTAEALVAWMDRTAGGDRGGELSMEMAAELLATGPFRESLEEHAWVARAKRVVTGVFEDD